MAGWTRWACVENLARQVDLESAPLDAYPMEAGAKWRRLRAKAAHELGLYEGAVGGLPTPAGADAAENVAPPGEELPFPAGEVTA